MHSFIHKAPGAILERAHRIRVRKNKMVTVSAGATH